MSLAMLDLNELLRFTVEQRGSDLHIKVGSPPHVRVDGHLLVSPFDVVSPSDAERMAYAILPKERADEFEHTSEADFAHSVAGLHFRQQSRQFADHEVDNIETDRPPCLVQNGVIQREGPT